MTYGIEKNLRAARTGDPGIAVLIPCRNEEASISKVVADFRTALPSSVIYVYDNNSTDRTAELAGRAGAVVRHESLQGKGNTVRRMFSDIDADIYVLVDGDDTYDAALAPKLIATLKSNRLDMVTAVRMTDDDAAYRRGHRFGNKALNWAAALFFSKRVSDMLSGYRIFSRRFVKSFPAHSSGFEIETELTIHALELRMPIGEMDTPYKARGDNSESKLSTYQDGARILMTIIRLAKDERPLAFFSTLAAAFIVVSLGIAWPKIFIPYFETETIVRIPTVILCTGMMILGFLSVSIGLILDTVTRGRLEVRRLAYLSIPYEEFGH